MSASFEWTEWHLTSSGWIRGSEKTDNSSCIVEMPPEAIATFRYSEEFSSVHSKVDAKSVCLWQVSPHRQTELSEAIGKYGECPLHL